MANQYILITKITETRNEFSLLGFVCNIGFWNKFLYFQHYHLWSSNLSENDSTSETKYNHQTKPFLHHLLESHRQFTGFK